MKHAITPEPAILFCPLCHCQHEDLGEWAERPHRKHRCAFCANEWMPYPFTTFGVATSARVPSEMPSLIVTLERFQQISNYSCTIPTGATPFKSWRRGVPYRGPVRWYLGTFVPLPTDAEGEVSIIWRQLFVAEWLAGEALQAAIG